MQQPESTGAAQPRRAFYSAYFTLYARTASTKKQGLRLAFGARTGTAVVRNRAKRLAREAFRLNRHQLSGGVEFLITAKRGIETLSRRDMREQLLGLFAQMRRLSPSRPSEKGKSKNVGADR
ncbi:MAG: ribonuclease P protein component [Kofleriaceae bacterium]|nr:ribonuclease P protein component [Candidatus Methylomirabilis lanthanidiphila]